MNKMKIISNPIMLTLCIVFSGKNTASTDVSVVQIRSDSCQTKTIVSRGEELVYEIKWSFIKLGTIRLQTFPNYSAKAFIDSYAGQPFVDIHSINETEMDTSFFSNSSWGIEKKGKFWQGLNYRNDAMNKCLLVEEMYQKDVQSQPSKYKVKDTLQLPSASYLDGLSVVYYPRAMSHTIRTVDVPTIVNGKLGTITFRFGKSSGTESISVIQYPVRVIEVDGTLSVKGIFGLTGDFQGWFSDDSAAVPIKAKVKVLLGYVTVELIQWKRAEWEPPKVSF